MFNRQRDPLYVENQRIFNWKHSDGRLVNEDDWERAEAMIDLINKVEEPGSVLVLGCRVGHEIEAMSFAWPEARIAGIDIVPAFIEIAKTKGEAYVMDMQKLEFKDDEFEWVVSGAVFEHAHDPAAAAREQMRVASKGIVVEIDLAPEIGGNLSHYCASSAPEEWKKFFEEPRWRLLGEYYTEKAMTLVLGRVQ